MDNLEYIKNLNNLMGLFVAKHNERIKDPRWFKLVAKYFLNYLQGKKGIKFLKKFSVGEIALVCFCEYEGFINHKEGRDIILSFKD